MDKQMVEVILRTESALSEYVDVMTRICESAKYGLPTTVRPQLIQQGALEARVKIAAWLKELAC